MQTQTFETSKGTLLAIRLPEAFVPKFVKYPIGGLFVVDSASKKLNSDKFKLPPGDWKEIGLWGSVPEEKAKEVVPDPIRLQDIFENRYFLYTREWAYLARTSFESLQSLLETKIKLVNIWGEKPEFTIIEYGVSPVSYEYFEDDLAEWQSAEAEVWKDFYLIFKMK